VEGKEELLGKCGISLFSRDEDDKLYIDSGFSHHMSRDRSKFHFLKKVKSGHVAFEGSKATRVLGYGKANLGENRTNDKYVWLIEGLKNNILSVSQIVDEGKEVIFNSKGFFIRKEGSKRVIAK